MITINDKIESVTAFAPATCANIAVGFDLLGFSIEGIGDEVVLKRHGGKEVIIEKIVANDTLPLASNENIASAVITRFCLDHHLPRNFSLQIHKGIPLGSGMGGSAASAVAALVALNGFLQRPIDRDKLAVYAVYGEELVSGQKHGDNVIPCLYGGLTLIRSLDDLEIVELPVPELFCVIVHPKLRVDTREARSILPKKLPLSTYVKQSANLASFIVALYEKRFDLLRNCLHDVLVEPFRSKLVLGFNQVKQSALAAGAFGASLSGSGPAVFALAPTETVASKIKLRMIEAFRNENIESKGWISKMGQNGALIIERI